MKVEYSDGIGGLLVSGLKRTVEAKGDMHEFLDECVGELASHHVAMGDGDHADLDAVDLWDDKTGGFEAGLRVGTALKKGERVIAAFVNDEEIDDLDVHLGGQWQFWFTGPDERTVREVLKRRIDGWVADLRKEQGLLPFPQK